MFASQILDSIPQSVDSLADRSLISAEAADIREITWKTENGGGNLVWMNENTWGTKEGAAAPKALENPGRSGTSWPSWKMSNTSRPWNLAPIRRKGRPIRFGSWMSLGKESSLTWDGLASETADPVTVWMEKDGAVREVKIKHEDAQRLNELLAQMGSGAKGKP